MPLRATNLWIEYARDGACMGQLWVKAKRIALQWTLCYSARHAMTRLARVLQCAAVYMLGGGPRPCRCDSVSERATRRGGKRGACWLGRQLRTRAYPCREEYVLVNGESWAAEASGQSESHEHRCCQLGRIQSLSTLRAAQASLLHIPPSTVPSMLYAPHGITVALVAKYFEGLAPARERCPTVPTSRIQRSRPARRWGKREKRTQSAGTG